MRFFIFLEKSENNLKKQAKKPKKLQLFLLHFPFILGIMKE